MTSSPAPDLEPRTEAGRVTPEAQPETVAHVHSLHIGGYGIWCGTRQGPGYGADGEYFKFDQTAELQAHLSAEAAAESGRLREAWENAKRTRLSTMHDVGGCFEVVDAIFAATPSAPSDHGAAIDAAHLARQREWSHRTFGPGPRTGGVLDHIRKELTEIEADPTDVSEWVDVVILALDGAWRAGWEPQQIIDAIKAKQTRNEARQWPDWRTASQDEAIEHVRAMGQDYQLMHGHDPALLAAPSVSPKEGT